MRLLNFSLPEHNRLQAIQNAFARAVTKTPKHHHITPVLKTLSYFLLLWPRRCHCTCQPLVYDCSPHSPVLRPACGLLKCQMQFSAVLSDHVNPSFPLSTPLSGSMYIAVVCYFGVSFVLHPIQKSECFRIFNEFRCLNS